MKRCRIHRTEYSDIPCTERGTGGVEVLGLGVLVCVMLTLLIANCWAVIDAKAAAGSAAREAARTAVEAATADGAVAQGTAAAKQALDAVGRNPERASVKISGAFERCQRIVATVELDVPAIVLPWLAVRATSFHVRASHSEVVDAYRSGLTGEARCV